MRQVSTMLYLTNVYGAKFGASALAANGLLRYLVGGSFPLFTLQSMFRARTLLNVKISNNFSVQQHGISLGFQLAWICSSRIRTFAMDFLRVW
jgi:hypothetical protein